MRILVVDDDATCAAIYQMMLSKFGKCDKVSTGLDAINSYIDSLDKKDPYHLMVVDIMMPDMNGYEVLQSIRLIEKERNISFPFSVRIVLTTALDDEENRKLSLDLDPLSEAYLVKSAYPQALLDKLEEFGFNLEEDINAY